MLFFEFGAELAVVVDGGKAVVDFTAGEDEAVFLGVGYHLFEKLVLVCHIVVLFFFYFCFGMLALKNICYNADEKKILCSQCMLRGYIFMLIW